MREDVKKVLPADSGHEVPNDRSKTVAAAEFRTASVAAIRSTATPREKTRQDLEAEEPERWDGLS